MRQRRGRVYVPLVDEDELAVGANKSLVSQDAREIGQTADREIGFAFMRPALTAARSEADSFADGDRLALRQKAVRRSHRLRHDNWVILGARCGRNSFSSGTTSVLRAVFASRDEPMASAPALQ